MREEECLLKERGKKEREDKKKLRREIDSKGSIMGI